MSFDEQKFSELQDAIGKKFSDFRFHQEPKLFEGQSLGGRVSVQIMLSNMLEYKVKGVKVDPSLMGEEVFMLEDLIKAAFNDAFTKAMEHSRSFLSSLMSFYF